MDMSRRLWLTNGTTIQSAVVVGNVATSWTIVGTGDFSRDGKGEGDMSAISPSAQPNSESGKE